MKKLLLLISVLLIPACSGADAGTLFEEYLWQNRLVLVFAPKPDDGRLLRQREILGGVKNGLQDRDIINWQFVYQDSVTIDGQQKVHLSTNPFYSEYDVSYRDFTVILIGKDGEVKLREDAPITAEKLFETTDAMPMRQREMQKPR